MANPSVGSLTLFDARADKAIGTISNGATINVDLKNTREINFRADVSSAASVRFGYDANTNFRTESSAPFAFAGDNGPGDYLSWTPSVGTHKVTARAFAGANATSTSSSEFSFSLKVTDSGTTQPPPPSGQSPYLGSAPSLPSQTVLFDNYDEGGEGVSYHDLSPTNDSGEYRSDGVDVEFTSDANPTGLPSQQGTGRAIGHVRAGEWLEYSVNVATAGNYKLQVRFASGYSGGNFHLEVDGKNVGNFFMGGTGGWQNWKTFEKAGIALPSGNHVLRFVVDSNNGQDAVGNLHWFRFVADTGTGGGTGGGTTQPGELKWPGSWSRTNSAPSARYEAMAHSFNGKLYIFGGYRNSALQVDRTYEVYNPSTNSWQQLGSLPAGMPETHVTPVDDGKYIYFVGGFKGDLKHDGSSPSQPGSSQVWRWEVATNSWTSMPRLLHDQGAAATAIVGRKIHIIGGNPSDRVTNIGDHYVLDLDNLGAGWRSAKPTPDGKDHASAVVVNGKIYVLGGEYGHDKLGNTQKSAHVYDPNTDSWTRLADMPFRSGHAEGSTFVLNGYIIFAGGQTTGQVATNRVAAYNPANNTWTELSHLPNSLQGTVVQPFGNKIIIAGGGVQTENPLKDVWIGYF